MCGTWCAVVAVVASSCSLGVWPDPVPAPDGAAGRGTAPVPGNEGSCGVARSEVFNPAQWDMATVVFTPTGGGDCEADGRPVILFGHGYTASFTWAYGQLIDHLVSRGFVVVYPFYSAAFEPEQQYAAMDGGYVAGIASLPAGRADVSRLGFVGHSWGAGMVPRMMQLASARGWGRDAMWAVQLSPAWEYFVGDGPIVVPANARVLTISYEWDVLVDTQIATEGLLAMTIADDHKQQMIVHADNRFDPALESDHLLPLTLPVGAGADHYDRWATWRPIDAWAGCALDGQWCDLDLADLGTYRGLQVRRATVGLGLPDIGPPALSECAALLSPRRCWG